MRSILKIINPSAQGMPFPSSPHLARVVFAHEVLELVRDSDCSAYDCEFVALAKTLGTKLVTLDSQILGAFPDSAVTLTVD